MKVIKNVYFLLPLTLIVWAIVAFRFWEITADNTEPVQLAVIRNNIIPKQVIEKPVLLLEYNDPFLRKRKPKNKAVKQKIKPKKIQKVIWPEIQYKGTVKSKRKKLIIITINNEQFVMGVGDEKYGIKVLKISTENFTLSYMKKQQVFLFE
jgi:hypothetical protein